MSKFTEERDKIEGRAEEIAQTFGQWFHAKPWAMTAICLVCIAAGFVMGKLL